MEDILIELGLSEREVSVYKALLKLGLTTTGPIIKHSSVSSAKIYEILDKLSEKGLVSYILKGKIKHFKASDPQILLKLLENKKELLQEEVKKLRLIQQQGVVDYQATIYEGRKALEALFLEMYAHIGPESEYYVFPLGEQLQHEELRMFWSRVLRSQQRTKIRIKTLPHKKLKKVFNEHYKRYNYITVRYTNQQFPTGIFIFKDYVLNVIWKEKPIGFLIKSKENYSVWKSFFEAQWSCTPNL